MRPLLISSVSDRAVDREPFIQTVLIPLPPINLGASWLEAGIAPDIIYGPRLQGLLDDRSRGRNDHRMYIVWCKAVLW